MCAFANPHGQVALVVLKKANSGLANNAKL